ncbi:efflux RND transporter periplasmic adaptor subunit [Thiomicrospira sp. S5]|uniref:efflux RND transporter periplasmic adaptor subunit n=1 Tax=Thiomicrospira sp. S5 TaxID=1803865 RepID=UPI0004A6F836|nr:hypothetical protein [Thiomicrospira sp. S5]AZR81300.1 hypothetical protein AYJ59_02750 [Thiomicrospira sp. S5]AZR81469.1 hypothetical protein AYJ59_03720 [Thiomicrospira sp. S5]
MLEAFKQSTTRYVTITAGLIVGALILAIFIFTRQPPPKIPDTNSSTPVRYIEARPMVAKLSVRGYGVVQSARPWQAIANVSGRITEFSSLLKNGAFVKAGTHLLTVDPSRYQLKLEQIIADLRGINADLKELNQEKKNTQALYQLESDRLSLAEQELARIQSLAKRDMMSENQVDIQKRATLQQRQSTQTLQNQLNQIPIKLEKLKSKQAQLEIQRMLATKDLEDTQIYAPFDLRIGSVKVQKGQQVNQTQLLFDSEGIETAEVPVQITLDLIQELMATFEPGAVNMNDLLLSIQALRQIEARIYPTNNRHFFWPAKITRIAEEVDPDARTLQVILSVEEPYRKANPPSLPPLISGDFVEGVLSRTVSQPQLVIPTHTVHQGFVYLVDKKNRLQRQAVKTSLPQGNWVLVYSGLNQGDKVILDDLVPAIEGMPLSTTHATDEAEKLANQVKEIQS